MKTSLSFLNQKGEGRNLAFSFIWHFTSVVVSDLVASRLADAGKDVYDIRLAI
jgi:hypothetical protein